MASSNSDPNNVSAPVSSSEQIDSVEDVVDEPLSKRKRKLAEGYLLFKEKRRAQRKMRKERVQGRKAVLKEQGVTFPTKQPIHKMADSSCNVKVIIDCSFNSLMAIKDISKLHHQLNHCYGINRRADNPLQLYFTSVGGPLLEKFKTTNNGDYERWDVNIHEDSLEDHFQPESIVYLSAESDNILTSLDSDKVYVIGGLVDHNHHKGHCHNIATEKNFQTARLPIGEDWLDLKLNQRSVLSITHVFEALLNWTFMKDWKQSLLKAIPKRKIEFSGHTDSTAVKSEFKDISVDDTEPKSENTS